MSAAARRVTERTPSATTFGCHRIRSPSRRLPAWLLLWLGQQYGSSVYGQLIRNYVPQYVDGGDWTNVTFANTSDMAMGNYISTKEEEDEDGPLENAFINAEPYAEKIKNAFTPFPHNANPGTTFVYQTHATFILTQAMNSYLQQRQGNGADIFNSMRDTVYKPIHLSQGELTTLRTDNSPTGKPFGAWGLFFIQASPQSSARTTVPR
jgi:hypothetical protein